MDKIRKGWQWGQWRAPSLREQVQPDRVHLVMPMVSLLPADSLDRLRSLFSSRMDGLNAKETLAIVTAEVEGSVSNARQRELTEDHPTDVTAVLQGLSNRGLLVQKGKKRGTYYVLPESPTPGVSLDSQHMPGDSQHISVDSQHIQTKTSENQTDKEWKKLERTAQPVAEKRRAEPASVQGVIVQLCRGRYLSSSDLARLLHRHKVALHQRYLKPMVEKGILELKFPKQPNNPDQAYRTRERKLEL